MELIMNIKIMLFLKNQKLKKKLHIEHIIMKQQMKLLNCFLEIVNTLFILKEIM